MNKSQFITQLSAFLKLPYEEKKEVIYDYEEHFLVGIQKGKTEEEIAKELGDPITIAKQYTFTKQMEKASETPTSRNVFAVILSAIGISFINLFFVLGPFLGIFGLLFGLSLFSLGVEFTGIVFVISPILKMLIPTSVHLLNPYYIMPILGVGICSLGLIFIIGMYYVWKYFYKITLIYLKWNINLITNK